MDEQERERAERREQDEARKRAAATDDDVLTQSDGTTASIDRARVRLTEFADGTRGPYSAIAADIRALLRADADIQEPLLRDLRMADYRWGKRLQTMNLRIDRAVAILHGHDLDHVAPVEASDLPFLNAAAHTAPLAGFAGVAVGACASLIEALMPVVAGRASINSRADAIAGVNLMTAQLALLCDANDYRSEYDFHLQMLRERHAKATETEIPF